MKKFISAVFRPAFGICLFLSQFTGNRNSLFTDNPYLLAFGGVFVLAGISLLIAASRHLNKAVKAEKIATTGPFKYVRHPIYLGAYVICFGLGLVFFAWAWFAVMILFFPFWYLEGKTEEEEMQKRFGQEYISYQEGTGMFFPKVF